MSRKSWRISIRVKHPGQTTCWIGFWRSTRTFWPSPSRISSMHHTESSGCPLSGRLPMFPLFQRRSPCSTWKRTWGQTHLHLVSQSSRGIRGGGCCKTSCSGRDSWKPVRGDPKVIYHHGPDKHSPCVVPWDVRKWDDSENHVIWLSKGIRLYWPQYFNW